MGFRLALRNDVMPELHTVFAEPKDHDGQHQSYS